MDRIQMPSAMPADLAEVLSDRDSWLDRQRDKWDELLREQNEAAAAKNALGYTAQVEFWTEECIDGPTYIAEHIAECLANLQASIDGDKEATSRIHRALHQIQRNATPVAEKALLTIYEGDV